MCVAEGEAVAEEMPAHQATIKLGLNQVEERWNGLNGLAAAAKEKSAAAERYYKLLGDCDDFLRDANRSLLGWSRKVSMLDNMKGGSSGNQDPFKGSIKQILIFNMHCCTGISKVALP